MEIKFKIKTKGGAGALRLTHGSSFLSLQFQLKFERKYVRVEQAFKCCFYDRPVIEVSEMQTVNPQIASYPSGQNC